MDDEKYFTFDGDNMPGNDRYYSKDKNTCPDNVRFVGKDKFPKKTAYEDSDFRCPNHFFDLKTKQQSNQAFMLKNI